MKNILTDKDREKLENHHRDKPTSDMDLIVSTEQAVLAKLAGETQEELEKISNSILYKTFRNFIAGHSKTEELCQFATSQLIPQLSAHFKVHEQEAVEKIESLKYRPSSYHHICWASGTVLVLNHWEDKEDYTCPYFNGDFNCGHRSCKSGLIKGKLELTEFENTQNLMLVKVLEALKEGG